MDLLVPTLDVLEAIHSQAQKLPAKNVRHGCLPWAMSGETDLFEDLKRFRYRY